jgi:hypothetical protein
VSLAWGRENLLESPRMQTTSDSLPSLQDEIDYSRRIVGARLISVPCTLY